MSISADRPGGWGREKTSAKLGCRFVTLPFSLSPLHQILSPAIPSLIRTAAKPRLRFDLSSDLRALVLHRLVT